MDIFHVDSLIVSSVILNVCNEKTEVTKRAFVGLWFLSASVQFSRHGHRNIRNFASFSSRISYEIILPRNDSRFGVGDIVISPKKKWYNIGEIDRVGWIFFRNELFEEIWNFPLLWALWDSDSMELREIDVEIEKYRLRDFYRYFIQLELKILYIFKFSSNFILFGQIWYSAFYHEIICECKIFNATQFTFVNTDVVFQAQPSVSTVPRAG